MTGHPQHQRTHPSTPRLAFWAGLLAALVAAPAIAQPRPIPMYEVRDLGTLAGGAGRAAAMGLNNRGEAVGWSVAPATSATSSVRPFWWRRVNATTPPAMVDLLPGLPGTGTATDLNEFGYAVGTFTAANTGQTRGFIVGGPLTVVPPVVFIPPLSGGTSTAAAAINDQNWVVGWSNAALSATGPMATRAILWRQGQTTDLGTLGGRSSQATGVNGGGSIVGVSDTAVVTPTTRPTRRGFVVPVPGMPMQALPALWTGGHSGANAISDLNLIVGWADLGLATTPLATSRPVRAVLWTPNSTSIINLGTLRNTDRSSEALGVNTDGDVVGWSGTPTNTIATGPSITPAWAPTRAFIWRDGVMHDLNDHIPANSGWVLHVASETNDNGQIVGWGARITNSAAAPMMVRAFLLTPVPADEAEPR